MKIGHVVIVIKGIFKVNMVVVGKYEMIIF